MIRQLLTTTALTAALAATLAASGAAFAATDGKGKEWGELVKAAQQEGEVDVILYGGINLHKGAVQAFEKKYGIKVNYQTGSSRQHAERILAERRLGSYTVDAWIGGANTSLTRLLPNGVLQPIDQLLMDPEVTDTSNWFQGKHHYTDPERRYIFPWAARPQYTISYNTNLVKPEEIKSYHDLLDPKWKGKIVSISPGKQGVGGITASLALNDKVGYEWFRRWANEMDVMIVEDARQGAEWVALGRFPIGMFGLIRQADALEAQGFPIRGWLPHPMKEGEALTSGSANIMAIDRAPHPNAMKLFVNWVLSREGQQVFIEYADMDSLRTDVDNSVISPQNRIQDGVDYYLPFTDPAYINGQKQILSKLRAVMQEAGY